MGNRFNEKKKSLGLMVIALGLIFIYYRYFFLPLQTEIAVIKEELIENENRLRDSGGIDDEIGSPMMAIETLEIQLKEQKMRIPSEPDMHDIIIDLDAFSKAAGVKLLGMDFKTKDVPDLGGRVNPKERNCLEVSVRVYISGTYEDAVNFLRELEGANRLYRVTGFELFTMGLEYENVLEIVIDLCAYALK